MTKKDVDPVIEGMQDSLRQGMVGEGTGRQGKQGRAGQDRKEQG